MSILEEQLTSLVEDGWRLMGVTDALRTIADEGASRIVALTFDDGLLDFLNAFEVLGRLAARATLYVPTDTVGERVSRWDRGHSRLGWEALGQLSAAGVEIGSKAVHNRVLDVLPEGVMCSEVVGSKRLLEDRLARTITSFCYPGGVTSARVRRVVHDAGYTSACLLEHTGAGRRHDLLGLRRIRVRSRITPELLRALVNGSATSRFATYVARTAPAWRMVCRPTRRAIHIAIPRR
jgi:peptidoglycan/xylan/chitin deacetylase (PgdA/CDA1 family)